MNDPVVVQIGHGTEKLEQYAFDLGLGERIFPTVNKLRQIVRHVRDRPLLRRQHGLLAVGGAGRVQEEPDLHAPQLQEELRPVRGGRLGPAAYRLSGSALDAPECE